MEREDFPSSGTCFHWEVSAKLLPGLHKLGESSSQEVSPAGHPYSYLGWCLGNVWCLMWRHSGLVSARASMTPNSPPSQHSSCRDLVGREADPEELIQL